MSRFAPAVVASAALVLAAPFIGQLRVFLQDTFPYQYKAIIATAVFGSVGVALLIALARIRSRRRLRYGAIVAAVALASGYAVVFRTGDPAVDAVERFHFVEYGLIALLFYRAWRPVGDASLVVLPLLAGLIVGTCEEWLQWFIPARVGELRDVFLNLWAVGCGVLFSLGLDPPERFQRSLHHTSWMRIRRVGAVAILAVAAFIESAHLGYEVSAPGIGVFRSSYKGEQLDRLAQQRQATWQKTPPLTWARLSREDQYFSEGITHVRARNRCWDDGHYGCAWRENLILERYFTPVITTPSYVSATGLQWPPDQRADAARRALDDSSAFVSSADENPIYVWPKWPFRAAIAVVVLALILV